MSIINHMYSKIIKKSLELSLKSEIRLKSIDNYLDFINYLDVFLLNIVKKSIKGNIPEIQAIGGEINQVLLNLLIMSSNIQNEENAFIIRRDCIVERL